MLPRQSEFTDGVYGGDGAGGGVDGGAGGGGGGGEVSSDNISGIVAIRRWAWEA